MSSAVWATFSVVQWCSVSHHKKRKKKPHPDILVDINSGHLFPGFTPIADTFTVLFSLLFTFSQRCNSVEYVSLSSIFLIITIFRQNKFLSKQHFLQVAHLFYFCNNGRRYFPRLDAISR